MSAIQQLASGATTAPSITTLSPSSPPAPPSAPAVSYSTNADRALTLAMETGQICIDLETGPPEFGLDPHQGQIGVVILETGGEIFLLREVPDWMGDLLEDPETKKLIFNAKFDLSWLFRATGRCFARNVQDLYLKELLIGTQRHGVKHNLQATLERRLGVEVAKDIDHSQVDWTGDLSQQMVKYALEDVVYMAQLDAELDRLLASTEQSRAAEIECDAVAAVAMMQLNGVPIDRPAWEGALVEWVRAKGECAQALDILIPGVKNWNSTQQIHQAILAQFQINLLGVNKKGEVKPSTAKHVLKHWADLCPPLRKLLEYRHWAKRVESWGTEYLNTKVCACCQRIRPSWNQIGADTGRFSCSKPNLQQIPRDKVVRALFRARPGYLICSIDYSAIEVLVAGVIAQDPAMIEAVGTGDPHTWLARMILGRGEDGEVTPLDRQIAKSANFHLIYFGGADGLAEYAKNTFEIVLTEQQSNEILVKYFTAFQGLAREKARVMGLVRAAHNAGEDQIIVRNLVGMRRILIKQKGGMKPTTYMNTRVQSSAGYGIKCAMRRLGAVGLTQDLIMQVHDELVFEFPEAVAKERAALALRCMIAGMKDVIGQQYVVPAEISMGEVWS